MVCAGDAYPNYTALQERKFQHNKTSPANGKYGDPAWDPAWDFYVEKEGRAIDATPDVLGGRGTTAKEKKKDVADVTILGGNAAQATKGGTSSALAGAASSSTLAESSAPMPQDEDVGQQGAAASAEIGSGEGVELCDTVRYDTIRVWRHWRLWRIMLFHGSKQRLY